MHVPCAVSLTHVRSGSARPRAAVLLASLATLSLLASPAQAVVTTLLSSETNVAGTLADDEQSWSDSDQSLDLAPSISVSQSFATNTSSNSFSFSAHAVSAGRLRMSTRSTAGAGGAAVSASASHDFTIRFSIDARAAYELQNGNSTGSFPAASATPEGGAASLVYELRREGGAAPVFVWNAPTSGAAGTYVSGVIAPGTYVWSAVASATANGDPCCGAQTASAIGNIQLQLEDAPAVVPALGPVAGLCLTALLAGVGLRRLASTADPS